VRPLEVGLGDVVEVPLHAGRLALALGVDGRTLGRSGSSTTMCLEVFVLLLAARERGLLAKAIGWRPPVDQERRSKTPGKERNI
jgi:hypothetical protein